MRPVRWSGFLERYAESFHARIAFDSNGNVVSDYGEGVIERVTLPDGSTSKVKRISTRRGKAKPCHGAP